MYKLIDEKGGETIFGRFYEWELQGVANGVRWNERGSRGNETKGPMDKYVVKSAGNGNKDPIP